MKSEDEQVEQVRALFDKWALSGRDEGMERGHGLAVREAMAALALGPDQHYLDVGCGNGYSVRWAAEEQPGLKAVGLDLSAEMIARARALSTDASNVRFIHAPFPLPMLKAKSFDAILSMEVFYYLPDLHWGILSAARLLKAGGRFACVVDYYEENEASHSWPEDVGVSMNLLSAEGWAEAMAETGLEVIEQRRIKRPLCPEETPDWRHRQGSLLTLARRPQ